MIEISHAQARRIIREGIDREVPGEQWSTLAAHLEGCAECCAYRDRHAQLERALRRGLRLRWNGVNGPRAGLDANVARMRRRSISRNKYLRFGVLVLAALIVLGGAGWYWRKSTLETRQAEVRAASAAATAQARVLPVQLPGSDFRGVVAFEAPPGSNLSDKPDIFLLNSSPAGSELTNLTQNPAADSDPAWSPDGEWLAFLSDREGKMEIYAMTVAGTHITRLTNDPAITWQGPLSWSADGQWIAAAGVNATMDAATGGTRWIYQVPVNGADAGDRRALTPLPYSRGARFPRFAPNGRWLAYVSDQDGIDGIKLHDAQSGRTLSATAGDARQNLRAGANGSFDWSVDGHQIIYLSQPTFESSVPGVRLMPDLDVALSLPDYSSQYAGYAGYFGLNPLLDSIPALSGVGFSPQGERFVMTQAAQNSTGQACSFMTQLAVHVEDNLATFPRLCIEGRLERSSWSTDGRWLVSAAHTLTEARAGVYAFFLPDEAERERVVISDRLIDLPKGAGALRVRPNAPRLSGVGPELKILPRPAAEADPVVAEAIPPEDLLRRVLGERSSQEDVLTVGRLSADGSRFEPFSATKYGYCLRASPDGARAAFIARPSSGYIVSTDIYVMDQLSSHAEIIPSRLPEIIDPAHPDIAADLFKVYFECPVWSPDGSQMAVWASAIRGLDEGVRYLVVIPYALPGVESADVRFFYITGDGRPYYTIPPVWSADGKELIVVERDNEKSEVRIAVLDASSGVESRRLTMEDGQDVGALALSPEGGFLAYTTTVIKDDRAQTELRIASMGSGETFTRNILPDYPTSASIDGYRELIWLGGPGADEPSMKIGLTFRGDAGTDYQSAFLVYDPASGKLNTLADVHEELYGAAWSPDRRWLLFSTTSGLWSLDVDAALAGQASPVWLSSQILEDMDWK